MASECGLTYHRRLKIQISDTAKGREVIEYLSNKPLRRYYLDEELGKIGTEIGWYANGTISYRRYYRKGRPYGLGRWWYLDGSIRKISYWNNEGRVFTLKWGYPQSLTYYCQYQGNKPHGVEIYWTRKGRRKRVVYWEMGIVKKIAHYHK